MVVLNFSTVLTRHGGHKESLAVSIIARGAIIRMKRPEPQLRWKISGYCHHGKLLLRAFLLPIGPAVGEGPYCSAV
jgi:hypothetical protein